jgi:hypothetical protein
MFTLGAIMNNRVFPEQLAVPEQLRISGTSELFRNNSVIPEQPSVPELKRFHTQHEPRQGRSAQATPRFDPSRMPRRIHGQ